MKTTKRYPGKFKETANMKKKVYYWHVHHDVLFEALTEPIKNRITYIENNKPDYEIPIRLKLMKPVRGLALAGHEKVRDTAWAEYEKVTATALAGHEKVRDTAWAEYEKVSATAWAEYEKVRDTGHKKIEALHKIQCPSCPWNGQTIFPKNGDN